MRRLHPLGIGAKLVLCLTLFALLLLAANLFVVLPQQSRAHLEETHARARSLAGSLASHSRPALLTYDYYSLERIASAAIAESDVLYVEIDDKEGEVAARRVRPGLADALPAADPDSPPPAVRSRARDRTLELADGIGVLDVTRPVRVDGSSDVWGTVRVGLDLRPVHRRLAQVRTSILASVVAIFLVGLGATSLLARRITGPLRVLHRRTLELTADDDDSPPPPGDEVAVLRDRFERMAARLASERARREQVNAELEHLVEERTLALRATEERYRALVMRVKDVVYITDADDRLVVVNPAGAELFGRPAGDLLGSTLGGYYADPEERQRLLAALARDGFVRDREARIQRPDGSVRHVVESSVRAGAAGRPTTEGIIKDVTDQRQLQATLAQAQRMETVGTLAGGVAHDFNNLLTSILAAAELIRAQPSAGGGTTDELAGAIVEQARRGADLTKQLLGFARNESSHRHHLDLHELVGDVVKLLGRTFDRRIVIRTELRAGELPVVGDRTQLQQVLVNLCVNARDAMPDGGTITIGTGIRDRRWVLEVIDTGCGIPENLRARVFEPFFTTKERGRGTGLGLSQVYGIVKDHGGTVDVSSEPGRTRFVIELPIASARTDQNRRPALPATVPGCGRILVIDDEERIRDLVQLVLTRHGYTAEAAADGHAGVDLFRRDRFDLVLLDMCMPGIDGAETFRLLHAHTPEVPVVIISGHVEGSGIEQTLAAGATSFLPKPFSVHALTEAVQQAIADRAGAASSARRPRRPLHRLRTVP